MAHADCTGDRLMDDRKQNPTIRWTFIPKNGFTWVQNARDFGETHDTHAHSHHYKPKCGPVRNVFR
jgi:hypothetical protein